MIGNKDDKKQMGIQLMNLIDLGGSMLGVVKGVSFLGVVRERG